MAPSTREQAAVSAYQQILSQDWFEPNTLQKYLKALVDTIGLSPRPTYLLIDGQSVALADIEQAILRFNATLPPERQIDNFDSGNLQHLAHLDDLVVEVSGTTPQTPESNMPANLKELVAEAQRIEEIQKELKLPQTIDLKTQTKNALEMYRYAQALRNNTNGRLFSALQHSSYVKDLQTIYGRDAVNRTLWTRIEAATSQAVTTFSVNQLGLVGDPAKAAAYFSTQLEKTIKADGDFLQTAYATTPKQEGKFAKKDIESLAQQTAQDGKTVAQAVQKVSGESPLVRKNAESISHAEIQRALAPLSTKLDAKKIHRLAKELAKSALDPKRQLAVLDRVLSRVPSAERSHILAEVRPAIFNLAQSSDRLTVPELTIQNSLLSLVRIQTGLFPQSVITSLRAGKLSTPETTALILEVAHRTGVPLDVVALRLLGCNSTDLTKIVHMLPRTDAAQPHLGRIEQALPRAVALEAVVRQGVLPPALQRQYQRASDDAIRTARLSSVVRIPFFSRFLQLPPVQSIGNVISGFRVQSGTVDGALTGFETAGQGFSSIPSFFTAPLRAAGSWANNTFVAPATSWAGTQIRAGAAKIGSWLAKKGLNTAAKNIAGSALGKGTVALLAQAAPIVGQVVGAFTLLSMLGDVGKLLWQNKKGIGAVLGGMFFSGQLLLGNLLGFIGSAIWGIGGGILGGIAGFLVGGPIGAAVGAGLGAFVGAWIGSGGLAGALSAIGSGLAGAASGVGAFLGSLGAPASFVGVGSAIATAGVFGSLTLGALLANQSQRTTNSALFAPGEGRGVSGPEQILPAMANEVSLDPACVHAGCQLQRALESCGIRAVSASNTDITEVCLSGFKPSTAQIISLSATHNATLQCVGFKVAAENEEGVGIISQNALLYVTNTPSNCTKITDPSAIQVGDNAVWGPGRRCPSAGIAEANKLCNKNYSCCGHIAVITRIGEGVDMDVTQAWGGSGIVNTIRTTKTAPALVMRCR